MKKSSLYTTPNNEPARSIGEWAQHFDTQTWAEIVAGKRASTFVFGLVKAEGGPKDDWRYVKLANEKILDMRHVLVVGIRFGVLVGIAIELGQFVFDRTSFNQLQDYYSNKVGARFLKYLRRHSIHYRHSIKRGNSQENRIAQMFQHFVETEINKI